MTDKHLEELQDILKSALELQSKMNACLCSIVLSGDDGVTLDVYPHQFTHLRNAHDYITSAIEPIWKEVEHEMKLRNQL
jgi:hypothetical protein